MLFILIVSLAAQLAIAHPFIDSRPQQQELQPQPNLVLYDTANMPNSYNFHYNAGDGSTRTEQGTILDAGTPQAALDVLGTVRWYDNKGQLYQMSYKAGKRGYRTVIKKIS